MLVLQLVLIKEGININIIVVVKKVKNIIKKYISL